MGVMMDSNSVANTGLTNCEKPKVGLLLMTAEWFTQIGASQGSFKGLPQQLQEDAGRINEALGSDLEIVNPGVIATRQQVGEAIELFQKENVDLIVACQITWGEDRLIIDAVQKLPNLPFLLWCYSPFQSLPDPMSMRDLFRASGPVGALQASAPLKRLGKKFGFAFGSYKNQDAIKNIVAFSRACQTARELRNATIGVLPYRCDQMTGTYVDEFRLKKEIGPELKYISVNDYSRICAGIPEEMVEAYVTEVKACFRVAEGVTQAGLAKAARVSLGLAKLVEQYRLDAVALEDVSEELHRVMGLRPCLYVPALFARAVVSMEAEVGGAVAFLMLRKLAKKPPMYAEIFTYDERDNCLLAGHAGIHDINLAEGRDAVLVEPDGEYVESEPDSCWMRFRAKGGHVTLLSVFCDVERFKMVITSGECLAGKEKLLGSPHAYIQLKTPLAEFFAKAVNTGMTQHWAVVHDDVVNEVVALADVLGLEKVLI
jgi:L-arabinose isomerase